MHLRLPGVSKRVIRNTAQKSASMLLNEYSQRTKRAMKVEFEDIRSDRLSEYDALKVSRGVVGGVDGGGDGDGGSRGTKRSREGELETVVEGFSCVITLDALNQMSSSSYSASARSTWRSEEGRVFASKSEAKASAAEKAVADLSRFGQLPSAVLRTISDSVPQTHGAHVVESSVDSRLNTLAEGACEHTNMVLSLSPRSMHNPPLPPHSRPQKRDLFEKDPQSLQPLSKRPEIDLSLPSKPRFHALPPKPPAKS